MNEGTVATLAELPPLPHRIGARRRLGRQHERLGRLAATRSDLRHGPPRRHRTILREQPVRAARLRVCVAMFDQQPVVALAAIPIIAHSHQDPAAVQSLAVEREFQISALERRLRILTPFGDPEPPIPQLHRTAAVLALGDGALKVPIVEWMIFDLDSLPFIGWIDRRPARHRPRFEHPVEFEPQIVVQPARGVFLYDEAQLPRRRHGLLTARLRGLGEVALLTIFGEKFLQARRLALEDLLATLRVAPPFFFRLFRSASMRSMTCAFGRSASTVSSLSKECVCFLRIFSWTLRS